jgi:hypothetical protein
MNATGARMARQRDLLKPVLYDLKCLTDDLEALQCNLVLKIGKRIQPMTDLHWHVDSIIKLIESIKKGNV